LLHRFKGEVIPVRNPHDLVNGIHRLASEIPRTDVPAKLVASTPIKPSAPLPQAPAVAKVVPPEKTESPQPAAVGDEDPVQLLMRLRDQVLAHAAKVPNHTCVETIQREHYESASGRFTGSCDDLLARRKAAASASSH